jgi:hypothetical protein
MSKLKYSTTNQKDDYFADEFHRYLGRLVHAFARFDYNIGLQLNYYGKRYQLDLSEILDPKAKPLGARLKILKRLILDLYSPAGEAVLTEFKLWFESAEHSRAIRNDYVHGLWGVPGDYRYDKGDRFMDATPLLTFVALHWNLGPHPDESISLTMEEFASQVESAERLLVEYFQLTEKYLTWTK